MSWLAFWNKPNSIYAGDRHLRAHYARLLADLGPYLAAGSVRTLLDFGCGEALAAEALAGHVPRVLLYDASPLVRTRLAARLGSRPGILVLDEAMLAGLGRQSVDLALMISVVQYLDDPALLDVLATLHRLLAPDGRLIVADIIEPATPLLRELASRLRFSISNGFFLADLATLFRLYLSDYRKLQRTSGFATYRPDAFAAILRASGFASERLPRNIGPTAHRLAFLARPDHAPEHAASAEPGATGRREAEAPATQPSAPVL